MSPNGDNPLKSEEIRMKRPVDDTWQEGHHSAKSIKSNEQQIAPQVQETATVARVSQSPFHSHHVPSVSRQSSVSAADLDSSLESSDRTPTPAPSGTSTPSLRFLLSDGYQTGSSSRESTPRLQLGEHPDAPGSLAIPGIPIGQQPSFAEVMRLVQNNRPVGHAIGSVQIPHHAALNFEPPADVYAQRKGKGKEKSKSNSALDQATSAFKLPPWPTRGALTYEADTDSQPHITPSTSSRPLPNVSPPNPETATPLDPQAGEGGAENTIASVMSFFSTGMVHFFNNVQKSNESSYKLIKDALNEFREDLSAIKGNQTTSNDDQSQQVQYVQLAENLVVPAPPPKKQRSHRDGIKSKVDRVSHHRFMAAIRQHSMMLLSITNYKYLTTIKCALTEAEDDAFNLGLPGHIELSAENFMLDCTRPRDSLFNSTAINVFVQDFLDKVQNQMWYSHAEIPQRYLEPEMIKSAFRDHFEHIKLCYRRFVVMPLEDAVAAKTAERERLRKSSRGSRKTRLLKMRLEAMVDDPELKRHVPLVKHLGTQAISSDESENECRRTISYPRIYPRWRSPQLAALLWQADTVCEINRTRPVGRRKLPGTQLRVRPHSNKYNEKAAAPIGLPRNCYDPDWLSGLTEKSKKALKAQDQEYNFAAKTKGETSQTASNSNPTIAGDDVEMQANEESAGSN